MTDRVVRGAFRVAIERYCTMARTSGLDTRGLRISIVVTTRETIAAEDVKWLNRTANDRVHRMLPGAAVHSVLFPVRTDLPAPGYDFDFRPPAVPRPHPTIPYPRQVFRPGPVASAAPIAMLTLSNERDFIWPCRIGAGRDWLTLGRLTGAQTDPAMVPLPTYAKWLPRGGLLLVRNQDGRLAFGRSGQRPQYEILVDRVPLAGPVLAAATGSLEYRHRHDLSSTLLTYRVDWEVHHV